MPTGKLKRSSARRGIAACSSAALAFATMSVGWAPLPVLAQEASVLPCFSVFAQSNADGKAVLSIPLKVVGPVDGTDRTLVAIDPACLQELGGTKLHDPYSDAKDTIDEVTELAKVLGVPDPIADKVKTDLSDEVDDAKALAVPPQDQVNAGNDGRQQTSKEKGDDKDAAMVAALASVAALCMVATSGVCAAAVASILPSLLPTKITTEQVQGMTKIIGDLNSGKPLTPADIKFVTDFARDVAKVKPEALSALNDALTRGVLPTVVQLLGAESGLTPEQAKLISDFIVKAVGNGEFDCGKLIAAAGITDVKPAKDPKIVDQIMAVIKNSKDRGGVAPTVEKCLFTIFPA